MVSLFGDSVFNDRTQDLQNFAEHLAKISDEYTAVQKKNKAKGQSEHYLVFVFPSGEHVDAFIKTLKLEDNRYQNGMMLLDRWGILLPTK